MNVQLSAVPSSKLGFPRNWTVVSEHDTTGVTVDMTGTICAKSASKGRPLPKVDTIAISVRVFGLQISECQENVKTDWI